MCGSWKEIKEMKSETRELVKRQVAGWTGDMNEGRISSPGILGRRSIVELL